MEYEWQSTPPDKVEIRDTNLDLLPSKSREAYETAYNNYTSWIKQKRISRPSSATDLVVLRYLKELIARYAASTLFSLLAKLKATVGAHENVEVRWPKCEAYLAKEMKNHTPKKSKIFEKADLNTFWDEGPDDMLVEKVASTVSYFGALRKCELRGIQMDHISTKKGEGYNIFIKGVKTMTDRNILVPWHEGRFLRKWIEMRPSGAPTALMLCMRSGKLIKQPIGVNTLAEIPQRIAKWLNLPEPEKFTGHAFRRTAATAAVDAGCDLLNLKKLGGWSSDSVAQGYIDLSAKGAENRAKFLSENAPDPACEAPPAKKSYSGVEFSASLFTQCNGLQFTGCTFNVSVPQ